MPGLGLAEKHSPFVPITWFVWSPGEYGELAAGMYSTRKQ